MSYKKTARQIYTADLGDDSTTSIFVKNHQSPSHLLEQVVTLYVRGHIHETLHLISCIIDNNNALVNSADLFVINAKALIELQGFSIDAQCALEQALLLEPDHERAKALKELCSMHEALRDGIYETTEAQLRKHLTEKPKDPYASYILGYHLFWKNGSAQEAVDLLEATVRNRPSFLKAWLCLGIAYKRNKDYGRAEEAFHECISLDNNEHNREYYRKHLQSL